MAVQGTQAYGFTATITKSDTVNLPYGIADAVYVGGAGDIVVVYQNGFTDTITCVAGAVVPIRAKRINSTSTTATDLHALYYRPEGNRDQVTTL